MKNNKYTLQVDKERQELSLICCGRTIETIPCSTGCGKPRYGFSGVTPNGNYTIGKICRGEQIQIPFGIDINRKPYGPYVAALKENPKLAIHGTDRPEELGRAVTAGCIRIHNWDMRKYVEGGFISKGTSLIIVGGRK